ncbi:MAG TPA: hypothetical protein VFL93_01100 [Longimicrobiaceae bacterium]|nr:hypothetical protein [Longimicrobiaceae bacterium]
MMVPAILLLLSACDSSLTAPAIPVVTDTASSGVVSSPAASVIQLPVGDSVLLAVVGGTTESKVNASSSVQDASTTMQVLMGVKSSYTTVRVPGSASFDPRQIADSSVTLRSANGPVVRMARRQDGSYVKVVTGGAYPSMVYYFRSSALGADATDYPSLVFQGRHAQLGIIRGTVNGGSVSASSGTASSTDAWASSAPNVVSVDFRGLAVAHSAGDAVVTHETTAGQDTFRIRSVETAGSADTASAPASTSGDVVQYPSAAVAFIAGPALKLGSALNPYPWYDKIANEKAPVHAAEALDPATSWNTLDGYVMYYDLGLTLYQLYYRSGDEHIHELARKVVDHWVEAARNTSVRPYNLAPRSVNLDGIILRALDGRPELWPEILAYVRTMYPMWLGNHLNDSKLWYGIRDGGFTLLYTAQLAEVYPDSAVRAEMKAKALAAATTYYARLQHADGGWYYRLKEANDSLVSQPFQVGFLMEGLIAAHQVTGDATIAREITRGVDWLYQYGFDAREPYKAMWYWVDEQHNGKGHGPATTAMWNARELNGTTIHAFGYAYKLTGDEKYRTEGDDVLEATFNYDPSDPKGSTGLAFYRGKEYNQNYRSSGHYLVWRLGF